MKIPQMAFICPRYNFLFIQTINAQLNNRYIRLFLYIILVAARPYIYGKGPILKLLLCH